MRRLGWCVLSAMLAAACGAGGTPASPGGGTAGDGPPRSTDQELARKVGELVMVGFRGARLEDSSPIVQQVRAGHVGGVVLFDVDVLSGARRNVESPEQLRALVASLQAAAPSPLLVAIDEEGGRVSRLKEDKGFPPTAPARQLGQRNDVAATRDQARQTARTLAEAGINLNFAPVVDLDRNPASSAIGALGRSYSADPGVVTAHARAVIEEHRAAGVLTALKHFPGHGSASGDSHLGLVDVTGAWAPVELDPYRTLVREGNVDMVMTAHLVNQRLDPAWPATLSPPTIDGLLRREIGFGGPVISDDLQMGAISDEYGLDTAVRQALLAGVDVLLLANNNPRSYEPAIAPQVVDIVVGLVRDGAISEQRIDESLERVRSLKQRVPRPPR